MTIVLLSANVGGCVQDPGAPLIPLPERPATVLPNQAAARNADGFPNILADPATVPGLPRPAAAVAADEAALAGRGARTAAAARSISTTSSAAAIAARGRNHVAEARAQIAASGRPQTGNPAPAALPATAAPATAPTTAAPAENPGVPIDPEAPLPRPVGVTPFTGESVAPAQ
ncbi:hypothetical protein RDV64_00285 [Acuticoccus sp. MNP-M23]|uniref:hypothetical protein n=1 Tax=Acuticoccus sp. MNP-M23 TaxID=3072793 RepID=UPI002814E88F|nr:hypothetical protein [Acuticoccus sp. MNP-M23]WMS42875.1 hypothetical protein RDV64_00285 [Acuticoccus sp. MNP-M23]